MPLKILIVADDPDFFFVLAHILAKEGYEVVKAKDGAECLKKVEQEKPDMVILDIMMPNMSGWDVCREIKAATPDIPVSMCSILAEPEEIEKSLKYAGADEHITKPLSFNEVLDTVSSV